MNILLTKYFSGKIFEQQAAG